MTQDRWSPVLPSYGGRLAPRVALPSTLRESEEGYTSLVEAYYLNRHSCLSIFSRPVPERWARKTGAMAGSDSPPWLENLEPGFKYQYLMKTFGSTTMSLNFQRKLSKLCRERNLATIKRWWQTTDGVVYPFLLTVKDPDSHYDDIDKLIKFSFENCANNYAHFISRMKSLRRLLRKDYALETESARGLTDLATYRKMYLKYFPTSADPHAEAQYLMCWAQTRATGLADSKMINSSLAKCENTLKTPRRPRRLSSAQERKYSHRMQPLGVPLVPKRILLDVVERIAGKISGKTAHVAAGPNACLECTRQKGGQTGAIKRLRRGNHLHSLYDYVTLECTSIEPRPVKSVDDLVSWSIQEALEHPVYTRCVRLHSVPEPSKARTITVCSLPYLVIVGVISKLLQPAIVSDITRAGLRETRNLWRFLYDDLNPNFGNWRSLRFEEPRDSPILALSSDLSEATDYGDVQVARQILHAIIARCSEIPGFPTGLANLAKTLFIGKRFCFRHEEGKGFRFFVKLNGWLMGDRITKVVFTVSHEIAVLQAGLKTARICGDDILAFSRSRKQLERYLKEVHRLGFKTSEEDTYISSRLAFYCEEACIPPQWNYELPSTCTRMKTQSIYIDYPRIRLMIPTCVETHAYSYTDIGRFALLGKETRWTHQNCGPRTIALFKRAGLLQHLMVPEPADVMCPYLPIEIGGDGAFPHSYNFLKEVVLRKSRNLPETVHRMNCLLTSKWGYRFVRNMNLNDVTHKYHCLVPKIQELRHLLPEEAVVEGNALLLGSIKVDGLEDPERTFFRIQRAYYWHTIFRTGEEPPPLRLEAERMYRTDNRSLVVPPTTFIQFHRTWRDLGFTFKDSHDYRVDTRYVHALDYMYMAWEFGKTELKAPDPMLEVIVANRSLLNESNVAAFVDHLKSGVALPPQVEDHLHAYVEADSYILHTSARKWSDTTSLPDVVLLVSGDKKLARELWRIFESRHLENSTGVDLKKCRIGLVPPINYLYGMFQNFVDWAEARSAIRVEEILDFGALEYARVADQGNEVFFLNPPVVESPLYVRSPTSDPGVVVLSLDTRGIEGVRLTYESVWSDRLRPQSTKR